MIPLTTTIFAHRGASKYKPENTFNAFRLALETGAEGIETDVQLTKDQVPILIHDEKLNRTTNGRGLVKNFTLRQLKQLDAGSWFSPKFKGTSLVTLEEFLIWAKKHSFILNLELKNNRIDYQYLEEIVIEMLQHYQMLDRAILSSFNPKSIARLRSFRNQVEVALLITRRTKQPLRQAKELKVHALHVKYNAFKRSFIQRAKQKNIPLRVFTVNRPSQMMRCFMKKCAGIFTDVPEKGIQKRNLLQGGS